MPAAGDDPPLDPAGTDVAKAPFKDGALISARGLSCGGDGEHAVRHVDFDISPGEFVTLVGPARSGKSALVSLLLGLTAPTAGRLERASDCIVGMVPQNFAMPTTIPMTVERFLTLGRRRDRTTQAAVLGEVGAAALTERQVANLRTDELQRVLIARALLRNPTLIVMDDPARGADYGGAADLYALASRLRGERGVAVLLVASDLHGAFAASDRIVCLRHSIVAEGRPDEVGGHPMVGHLFGPLAARLSNTLVDGLSAASKSDRGETRR